MPSPPKQPLILVNKDRTRYSETFIRNHIERLNARVLSISKYLPLSPPKKTSAYKELFWRQIAKRNSRRLEREIGEDPGVVLIEYGSTAASVIDFCIAKGIQIVVHFHGYDAHRKTTVTHLATRYRKVFEHANAIVVVSNNMRRALLALGAPDAKLHNIVYGVNPAVFSQFPREIPAQPVFFAFGRLVPKKAPHLTIRAFAAASKEIPGMQLYVAGDGPLMESSRALVSDLDLASSVHFLGVLPLEEIARRLASCTAMIQHSVVAEDGDAEGTPNSILEAGASGVPVISTRHAGIPDVVVEDETGVLVDEGDVAGMADAMIRLARNPSLVSLLGENARKRVVEGYTLDSSIARLKELLNLTDVRETHQPL